MYRLRDRHGDHGRMSRLIYGWLTSMMASVPLWLGYALADLFAEAHYRLFPSRRHGAIANLANILPGASRQERSRVVRRMMASYNKMLFEFFRLPHMERRELLSRVDVIGREHLEHAVERGRGVIITCTHVGNWELAGVVLAHWGYTLHAVAGVQLNRWLTGAVRETKSELAIHTVSPEDGFRKLLRALEHNDLVALMVDGDIYRPRTAPASRCSAARLASAPARECCSQRTGAPIICGFCELICRTALPHRDGAGARSEAFPDMVALHAAVAAHSERHIRDHVEQWCIFRPLWEGTPAEAPASVDAHRVEA
jgi:KDO2-lipid IV(A) lauroyltransferase